MWGLPVREKAARIIVSGSISLGTRGAASCQRPGRAQRRPRTQEAGSYRIAERIGRDTFWVDEDGCQVKYHREQLLSLLESPGRVEEEQLDLPLSASPVQSEKPFFMTNNTSVEMAESDYCLWAEDGSPDPVLHAATDNGPPPPGGSIEAGNGSTLPLPSIFTSKEPKLLGPSADDFRSGVAGVTSGALTGGLPQNYLRLRR